tara:strand:+ start:1890 stop:2564 length:675 start_codon:yes stop_codon:yes gene_type:complete
MKRFNKTLNYLLLFLVTTILIDPIHGGYGGEGSKTKPEKIKKYKTPELVRYVNLSVFYLNSTENINKRHLKLFTNCQRLFNSNKTKVKGQETKYLKSCQSLMRNGIYSNEALAIIKQSTKKSNLYKKEIINKNDIVIDLPIENSRNNKERQINNQAAINSSIKNSSNEKLDKNKNLDINSNDNFNNKNRRNKIEENNSSKELIRVVKEKRKIKKLKEDSGLFFY